MDWAIKRQASGRGSRALPTAGRRRLALLGGTTTWGDCLAALRYLADPRRLVDGPAIADYERAFAQAIGVRHAVSFAAGRVGLYGLLQAMGIGPGDEVLLQVPTHIVVANAIRYAGARPVYVDCRLDTYNMDLEQAEQRVTPRTKILLLQHTFGIPVDMEAALALAQRHHLLVIEDCVHSLGARYAGRPVGSFGRAAFFSTEETKTISSTMGGMAVTDDAELAGRLRAFQASCARPSRSLTARYVLKLVLYHLLTQPALHRDTRALYERMGERHPLPRPTSRSELRGGKPASFEQGLGNAQAALALRQLNRLEANVRHRSAVALAYRTRLDQWGFHGPSVPRQAEPSYVRYPVWVDDRRAALRALAPHTVPGTWFTSVLEEAVSPRAGDYEMGSCPNAELAATHLINLPTHPRVQSRDVRAISAAMSALEPGPAR
ncbi:MAG TPA: aminotransferase class I/II-fold pyridoxal phosphate-dependent enzyme [Candidatus Dormibacteraeota bacterium]|nr:aminotransferase class I/II-fold pyridoxal phosphate-dependent enzyme [Candidatus Dormibacteraeota bacterium]